MTRKQIGWGVVVAIALLAAACTGAGLAFKKEDRSLFSGTIETREARIGSKIGGRVTQVLVEEGQEVRQGAPLVRFDVADVETQRAQAEARVAQARAQFQALERGARPQELAQARAATETARANLDAVRNWPRPEEVAQARAAVAAAEAEVNNSEAAFERIERLRATGDIAQQEYDAAKYRVENLRARRDAERKRLDLLLNGSRREDVRAAEERLRQAQEAEKLVVAGPRAEEIAAARAQVAEAQARLAQINVQLTEGAVTAPSNAVIESLAVRPGDLLTPNQPIARLLEKDQIFVRIYVPEPQLGHVRIGQRAKITVDSFPNQPFDGVIEQINSQGEFTPRNIQSRDERAHQVFGVKVKIDNREGKLKSGMAADVKIQE